MKAEPNQLDRFSAWIRSG